MASPQTQNGFTRIANEILQKVYSLKFNATQLKILLVIWRFTYGFQRKEAKLSIGFISKATNISQRYITKEMQNLIKDNVVEVVAESSYTEARKIKFNKNYDEWVLNNNSVLNYKTGVNNKSGQHMNNSSGQVMNYCSPKKESIKENNKEIYIAVIDYLNLKAKKNFRYSTKKTQSLINARLREGYSLDDFQKVVDIKTSQWINDSNMCSYLRPETLFGTKFESYLNEKPNIKKTTIEKEKPWMMNFIPEDDST